MRPTLLTGQLPTSDRKRALLAAASGSAGIVVGTHALLGDTVQQPRPLTEHEGSPTLGNEPMQQVYKQRHLGRAADRPGLWEREQSRMTRGLPESPERLKGFRVPFW